MKKYLFSLTIIISFILSGCSSTSTTVVNENGKYGFLQNDGKVVVKPIYDELLPISINDEYAVFKLKDKYGIVKKDGKVIVEPIYDSISKEFNGLFIIEQNKKFGYLNDKFKVVQKPAFKDARAFLYEVAFVKSDKNDKWGCLTKDMQLKIDGKFDNVYNIYHGYARILENGKWGFLDDKCNEIVKPQYEYVYDFSNGYAKVVKNGHVTYINEKGKEISKPLFTLTKDF